MGYELNYSTDGGITYTEKLFPANVTENNDIRIPTNQNAQIRARLRYNAGVQAWSKVVAYGPEVPEIGKGENSKQIDTASLIPIVVGVAVLLVVIIVVAVVLMRRKKSRMLDAEKNGGSHENGNRKSNGAGTTSHHNNLASEEETQKLNANHDNADNFA